MRCCHIQNASCVSFQAGYRHLYFLLLLRLYSGYTSHYFCGFFVCLFQDSRGLDRARGSSGGESCKCKNAAQCARAPRLKPTKSCAPASYRHGRDGACTRLLLCGPEAELPGSLSHSLSRYSHSGGSSTISRSYHQPHPKTLKQVFGLGGGVEARDPQKMNHKLLGS